MAPNEMIKTPTPAPASLLVVEDDAAVLVSTCAILEERYTVRSACTAEGALRILQMASFNVIVADWQLPGMDGLTFFERVAALPKPTAYLLVSGHVERLFAECERNRRRLLGFLAKPYSPAQLLNRVDHLVRVAAMKEGVQSMGSRPRPTKITYPKQRRP